MWMPFFTQMSSLLNPPMGYSCLRRFPFLEVQHEPYNFTKQLQKDWGMAKKAITILDERR